MIPPSPVSNYTPSSSSGASTNPPSMSALPPPMLCSVVRIYWEANYDLYNYDFHDNLTATQNYLLGLFNQVATIYQNEGITVVLSETYVWTTPDPYDSTGSAAALTSFTNHWNALGDSYNGDLAQLIAGKVSAVNGGIAWLLPSLCAY